MQKPWRILALAGMLVPGLIQAEPAPPAPQGAQAQDAASAVPPPPTPAIQEPAPSPESPRSAAVAEAPPAAPPAEALPPAPAAAPAPGPEDEAVREAAITAEPNVSDDIEAFLASKGWTMGENTRPDGSVFFISTGQGVIVAPRERKEYLNSRLLAFEKAVLDAKRAMIEYIGSRVVKEVESSYAEGGNASPTDTAGTEKARQMIRKEMDGELQKKGLQPDSPEAATEVRALLSTARFRSATRTLSQSDILGLQVFKTFEASPAGRQGQVGVICIHSDRLQQMAESMWTGAPLPPQPPQAPLASQLPSDSKVLLSSYGVQQKTDENGNPVLVAFAQAFPVSATVQSENAAYDKAKTNALGMLRQYAGESAHVATASSHTESVKEFEASAIDYFNDAAYTQQVQTYAGEMNIQGVTVIRKWSTVHPLTGGKVVGVVCAWSPSSARRAGQLKSRISGTAGQPLPSGNNAAEPARPRPVDSYRGQGAEADPDSF